MLAYLKTVKRDFGLTVFTDDQSLGAFCCHMDPTIGEIDTGSAFCTSGLSVVTYFKMALAMNSK